MGRRPTGTVEPLKGSIRLKFTWLGKRCVETLPLDPTPANIRAAEKLMGRVQAAIVSGSYRPSDFFQRDTTCQDTFKDYAESWLETLVGEKSTKRSYRTAINSTWKPLHSLRLVDVRPSDIRRAISAKEKTVSGKTINNALTAIRGVYRMAEEDELVQKNPTEGIENLSHQPARADPFEAEERDAILKHMAERYPEAVADYYEFAFQTGMRPSEMIALRWGDVDWKRQTIRVQRARVDWEDKGTKTNRARDVDLSDAAMSVLKRRKADTFLSEAPIFHNPATSKPWNDEQVQRRRYWNPTLKALGLRQRDAYQTRHTFASLALMAGINPAYIAKQLGHSNPLTTMTVYAHWIEGADKGAERAKMNALLSINCPRKSGTH